MATLFFSKYQGTGNDFILIDNRSGDWNDLSVPQIQKLCDRRFGIGADGLILINNYPGLDFEADYYNSDGSKSFCGNGARCAVAFAKKLGIISTTARFQAIDGFHEARFEGENVSLGMLPVDQISFLKDHFVLDTGSPHFVKFTDDLDKQDIVTFGRSIRYGETYKEKGINVNLVQKTGLDSLSMLTYERGVEDETLSCGTGATAVALCFAQSNNWQDGGEVKIQVKGGHLSVSFTGNKETGFHNIRLIGPAEHVFDGSYTL